MNLLHRWGVIGSASLLAASLVHARARAVAASVARQPARDSHRSQRHEPQIDFARDIQPIFKQDRAECHGPSKARGRLRLHTPDAILRGGLSGPPITPGKSDSQPPHPPRDGPRRRGSDAARRRTAAGGDDRAPARVDRSRRAHARNAGRRRRRRARRSDGTGPPIPSTGRT